MTRVENREEIDRQLVEPIPGRRPSPEAEEAEAAEFMQFMGTMTGRAG